MVYYSFSITLYEPSLALRPGRVFLRSLETGQRREEAEIKQVPEGWRIEGYVDIRDHFPYAWADWLALTYPTTLIEFLRSLSPEYNDHVSVWRIRGDECQLWQQYEDVFQYSGPDEEGADIVRHVYVEDGVVFDPPRCDGEDVDRGLDDYEFGDSWGDYV